MERFLFVMILLCTGHNSGSHNNGHINFPGGRPPTASTTDKSYVIKSAPSCSKNKDEFHSIMCENDEEYDQKLRDRFSLAIANSKINMELFTNLLEGDSPSVRTRFGGDFVFENPVCLTRETLIYPRRGQTQNNDWVYLLNQDNLQQAIRVEICHNEGSRCSLDNGEETVCRQKYIYRKLLAMDQSGTKIVPESILAPSCCICYRKSPDARFGFGTRDLPAPTSQTDGMTEERKIQIKSDSRSRSESPSRSDSQSRADSASRSEPPLNLN